MNIKKINDNKFDFKSEKATVLKVFSLLANYKHLNYSDVEYKIKALIKVSTSDLNYILDFLLQHNFINVQGDLVHFNLNISEFEIFDIFKKYVLNRLYEIDLLKNEIFDGSKFIVLDDDILIETNSIPISYRNYFQILENMELMVNHSDLAYKKVLDFNLGEILLNRPLKKISLIEFEKIQLQKKIKGEKAEKYVFELECIKLKNTEFSPKILSFDNITLGYDIKSYSVEGEEMYIEVKALTDKFSFFWSDNEVKISKFLNSKYFIYCVEFYCGEPKSIFKVFRDPYKLIVLDKIVEFRQIGDLEVSLS